MAARLDLVDEGEQGLLEHGDMPAQPQAAAGWRRAARVLGGITLAGAAVAGLAGLGHMSSADLGAVQMKAAAKGVPPEDAESRYQAREKLEIEKDLTSYVTAHLPRGAKPGKGRTTEEAAGALFDHVVDASGLGEELTKHEKTAFKSRFVTEMGATAEEASGKDWSLKYVKAAQAALESQKPVVTESLVQRINKLDLGFTTKMEKSMVHESKEKFQSRLGSMPLTKGQINELKKAGKIPEAGTRRATSALPSAWDAREAWPECAEIIGRIHNQGHCGSCWVFGALAPLDSRMCIKSLHTKEKFKGSLAMLSRGYAASCSIPDHDGCQGGWEYLVYDHIEQHRGLPSTACSPYFATGAGAEHFESNGVAPECPAQCGAEQYPRPLAQDFFKPAGVGNYQIIVEPTLAEVEYVKSQMLSGGPVTFAFAVTNEFFGYESGVWTLGCDAEPNHAVHTIGWGSNYLLAQNSWTSEWGDQGRFKVALCVPYEFTIPGDFPGDHLGALPFPASAGR